MIIEINLPTATETHRYANQCATEIAQQREHHHLTMVKRGLETLPKFIDWLTQLIEKRSSEGYFSLSCNLVDTYFLENNNSRIDPRNNYHFDGYFTKEMGNQIEKLFKLAGYKISVWCYNCSTYRTAEILINW